MILKREENSSQVSISHVILYFQRDIQLSKCYKTVVNTQYTATLFYAKPCRLIIMLMRDFSSFNIMLLQLKLQTCFVLPGLISTIRSFQNTFKMYNNYASRVLNQNSSKSSIYASRVKYIIRR